MTISRVSITLPLLHTQLGYPVSGSTDCAVRTCQSAIEFATFGQQSPKPEELRPLMGAPKKGGTRISQANKAMRKLGIEPLRYPKGHKNRGPAEQVIEWLRAGYYVGIYGRYGAILDGWPQLAGSSTYRAGHAVGLFGWDAGDVLVFDPLFDGRKPRYPRGPQVGPFAAYAAFSAALVGSGKAMAYAVPLGAAKVVGDPVVPQLRSTIATLEKGVAQAQADKATAEARAATLSSAGGYLLGDIEAAAAKYRERIGG